MSKAVDYRETLVTYLNSASPQDAAKTLGISYQTLHARIGYLRKAGVKVPKLKTTGGKMGALEIAQLNSIINKHMKENS